MSRIGKIGRLPHHVREQLNGRLADGEPGPQILEWLNGLPDAQKILERDFGGRTVNEQNLTAWRQGGFIDWQKRQEACDHVRRLTEQAEALDEAAAGENVTDRLATVFTVELFKVLEELLEQGATAREKLNCLQEGLREIRLLRRGDHNAARLQMESERWERQRDQENEDKLKEMKEDSKAQLMNSIFATMQEGANAKLFGGGEIGRRMAEMITRIQCGKPLNDLINPNNAGSAAKGSTVPDQAESR
jgi:hypothetical protein